MKGKILRYGVDDRDHLVYFHSKFYKRYASEAVRDDHMTPQTLGKNWSCFLYERDGKRFLCFFDGDDGSGGTPSDCKLVWSRFQNLLSHYQVQDYAIFKVQHARESEQREFYPFKSDVYPLALMTNHPERVFKLADEQKPVEKDIDVLFVGGKVHDHNYPYCWPKHRNTNQHWPTNRRIGYSELLDIKTRRKDLKIVAVDGLLAPEDYYPTVARAKICLDFPGIGVSSRKFYEFMVLGKCVLALQQNNSCWPIEGCYWSLGVDYGYELLERRIDFLLGEPELRADLEKRAAALRPLMSHEAVGEYVVKTFDEFTRACLDGTIEKERVWYR